MRPRSRRQTRWLVAAFAAILLSACITWWMTTALNKPDLDLFAVLVFAAIGASAIAWSGKRV